ncbi:MAG: hypothetical protein PVG30_02325 [Gammaproteobacteria bacterium]|jgi:hypothetical protein
MNKQELLNKLKNKVFEITKSQGFLTYLYKDIKYTYGVSVFDEKIIFNVFEVKKKLFGKQDYKAIKLYELTQKEFEILMYNTLQNFIEKNKI